MSTIGDVLRSVREVLLLQSQVERLEEQIDEQNGELKRIGFMVIDLDKRLFALERVIDLAARGPKRGRLSED